MQLHSIRGGTKELLLNKHYTIGIGISLGNKWFTVENIVNLIDWSLRYTKDAVIVYVADRIYSIDIEVRNRKSPSRAREKALKMGSKILEEVKEAARKRFNRNSLKQIHYARWDDFVAEDFKKRVDFLYKMYRNNASFKQYILGLVDDFIKNDKRNYTEDEKIKLGTYLIEELPELLDSIPINGLSFNADAYPLDGQLFEFAENIQKGKLFPEIKDQLVLNEPKVALEVR